MNGGESMRSVDGKERLDHEGHIAEVVEFTYCNPSKNMEIS